MENNKKQKGLIREYAEAILIAGLLAIFIRTFVVQAYKIPSGSMETTLLVGDQLLVNKFIYGIRIPFTDIKLLTFKEPRLGDIIVFEYPEDHSKDFIKRVIGVEGDTVEIKDKKIYINGKPIDDPWGFHNDRATLPERIAKRDNFGPIVVPKDSFFVMGDNRDYSHDSRFWGFVKKEEVVGKALIIYWSWESKNNNIRWRRLAKIIN